MKKTLLTLTFAFSFGAAASELPLIVKSSSSGYVPVEWARSEKCELFAGKVRITKEFGGKAVSYQLALEGGAGLADLVEAAFKERAEEEKNLLCDGPSTVTYINGSSGESLVLYSSGGCGTPKRLRQGPSSQALMDFIDTFCTETF